MAMYKIYIGNLNFETTEQTLRSLFEKHGAVDEVILGKDEKTGKPTGFAFVLMPDAAAGEKAVEATNRASVDGRQIIVKPSHGRKGGKKPKPQQRERPRGRRGFRGARAGGSGRGYSGGYANRRRPSSGGGEGGGFRPRGYSGGSGRPETPKPDPNDDSFGNR